MTEAATLDPQFLTTGAVARALDVSESTVRKYDGDGRLHAIRSSTGVRLFRREDVESFREKREGR